MYKINTRQEHGVSLAASPWRDWLRSWVSAQGWHRASRGRDADRKSNTQVNGKHALSIRVVSIEGRAGLGGLGFVWERSLMLYGCIYCM